MYVLTVAGWCKESSKCFTLRLTHCAREWPQSVRTCSSAQCLYIILFLSFFFFFFCDSWQNHKKSWKWLAPQHIPGWLGHFFQHYLCFHSQFSVSICIKATLSCGAFCTAASWRKKRGLFLLWLKRKYRVFLGAFSFKKFLNEEL